MVLAENGACLTLLGLQRRKPTENMTITEIASATRIVYIFVCEQATRRCRVRRWHILVPDLHILQGGGQHARSMMALLARGADRPLW